MDEDGSMIHDPVQECNDLINNRGCVKQYVNRGEIHTHNWFEQFICFSETVFMNKLVSAIVTILKIGHILHFRGCGSA